MKIVVTFVSVLILSMSSPYHGHAQGRPVSNITPEEMDRHKERVRDLVSYLEGTLNFLGSPKSTVKEKEVIINESFLKVFKDDKVQVEDDLTPSPLNIEKNSVPGFMDRHFFGHVLGHHNHIRHNPPFFTSQIIDAADMFLGHDQQMDRGMWIDILKYHHLIVFE